jgi:hypothetical protein
MTKLVLALQSLLQFCSMLSHYYIQKQTVTHYDLRARDRDNIIAEELDRISRIGVMPHQWNGVTEREKLSSQRSSSSHRKKGIRDNQLEAYEKLIQERTAGINQNGESLKREATLKTETKALRAQLRDERCPDLKEKLSEMITEIERGKQGRRDWALQKKILDGEIQVLKDGGLSGVRVNGRRQTSQQVDNGEPSMSTQAVNTREKDMASVQVSAEPELAMDSYPPIDSSSDVPNFDMFDHVHDDDGAFCWCWPLIIPYPTLPITEATQVLTMVPAFLPLNETPGGLHPSGPLEHESFSDSLLMQFDTVVDANFGLTDVPMSPTLSMFGDTAESDVDEILEMLDEAMAAFP